MDRVCYLMLRAGRTLTTAGTPEVSGVVERLDTGEKHAFASGQELMEFVIAAVGPASNFGAVRIDASPDPKAAGPRVKSTPEERRTP